MDVEQYNLSNCNNLPLNPVEIQVNRTHVEIEPTSEQEVVERILNDDRYVRQALLTLYGRQKADEQAQRRTIHRNGIGFNAADARVFTPIAEKVLAGEPFSPNDFATCRKLRKNGLPRLAHYRRQLPIAPERSRVQ